MTFLQLLDTVTRYTHEVLAANRLRRLGNKPPLQLAPRSLTCTWWDAAGQCYLVDVTEQVQMLVEDAEAQLPELQRDEEAGPWFTPDPAGAKDYLRGLPRSPRSDIGEEYTEEQRRPEPQLDLGSVMSSLQDLLKRDGQ